MRLLTELQFCPTSSRKEADTRSVSASFLHFSYLIRTNDIRIYRQQRGARLTAWWRFRLRNADRLRSASQHANLPNGQIC